MMRIPEQKHLTVKEDWLDRFIHQLKSPKKTQLEQDRKKSSDGQTKLASADDTKKVYAYLKKNYPIETLDWVDSAAWKLAEVPLTDIQMDRRPGGAREVDKVKRIAEAFKKDEEMEPVVLVQVPDGKMKVADGYHRTLGCRHAGKTKIKAWVGSVEEKSGPWDKEMHEKKLNKAPLEKTAAVLPVIKGIGNFAKRTVKSTAKEVGDYGRGVSGMGVRKAKENLQHVKSTPNVPKVDLKAAKGELLSERVNQAKALGLTGIGLAGLGINKINQQNDEQKNRMI